ncbi:MAG: hypothetical protein Q9195_000193 [Heterodermia aff. obscurata]
MPTIEVLPSSTSISAPGWAYVPDTGYDPSKAPLQPTARKRAARTTTTLTGPNTISNDTRAAAAVAKHIAELDKESHRDVQINLSGKGGGGGTGLGRREKDKKMTTNVRRILTSNKTFANHLADEEAGLEQGAGGGGGISTSRPRAAASAGMRRTSMAAAAMSPPPPQNPRQATANTRRFTPPATTTATASVVPLQSDSEDDLLLRTYIPAPPSAAEMEALVSAPPLSYNQARAAPPAVGKPQRTLDDKAEVDNQALRVTLQPFGTLLFLIIRYCSLIMPLLPSYLRAPKVSMLLFAIQYLERRCRVQSPKNFRRSFSND